MKLQKNITCENNTNCEKCVGNSQADYRRFASRPRDEKNMQDARNLREKKGAHEIM